MNKPFSLSKNERLKSKKQIDALFLQGEAFFIFPYKIKYSCRKVVSNPELRFGISVPKKQFKKAVDRNRLKRLTREAYRQQKVPLQKETIAKTTSIDIMFIYVHNELMGYHELMEPVQQCIAKVLQIIQKDLLRK